MNGVKMWLDDVRDPKWFGLIKWCWVKTGHDAICLLKTGLVTEASLDHDLTPQHNKSINDGIMTGYDVVVWMKDNNAWPAEGTHCHSAFEYGKAKIEQVIKGHYQKGVK